MQQDANIFHDIGTASCQRFQFPERILPSSSKQNSSVKLDVSTDLEEAFAVLSLYCNVIRKCITKTWTWLFFRCVITVVYFHNVFFPTLLHLQ